MKNEQEAQEFKEMEKELQSKDSSLEKELVKKIEEKKEKVEVKKKLKVKIKKLPEDKFGIETIRIPKEGVYEINLDALMKKQPLVILEKEGVYLIHLPSAFEKVKERFG
jgi:predicted  nucleic acid-binding Zn-ribbon protein